MGKKQMSWKTRGMNRDLSVSAFNPEFAFENRNLRLSTNENNTMLSWVNEKGTKEIILSIKYYRGKNNNEEQWDTYTELSGIVIGTAVLNDKLVLFTHSATSDYIYSLSTSSSEGIRLEGYLLYSGNLGFDLQHPIETLVSYESEKVQKVYWTDNKNQPRVINIATEKEKRNRWNAESFDFVRTLQLQEDVYVKKILGASGVFPAGVIQYAFTYYDKYGQESNIFYTSPLLYTSHRDRGGSPEDKVDNAFEIKVNFLDENFEYLRIYSIMRTSINGTPICKRVQDISITDIEADANGKKHARFVDTGNIGDAIDPTELLYKGGENIVCKTMEQKDNTLFFGNLNITRTPVTNDLETSVKNNLTIYNDATRKIFPEVIDSDSSYSYENQLTSLNLEKTKTVPCGGFKMGELYRLGLQFQYKTGKWSDPINISDLTQEAHPDINTDLYDRYIDLPVFKGTLDTTSVNKLIAAGYKKVRPVCVFPGAQDRKIVCQGVVNPTLFTNNHRYSNGSKRKQQKGKPGTKKYADGIGDLHAQSSWFFRGGLWDEDFDNSQGSSAATTFIKDDKSVSPKAEGFLPYYKGKDVYVSADEPGDSPFNPALLPAVEIQGVFDEDNQFQTDYGFLTFHSPDVEFDTQLSVTSFSGMHYRQVGNSIFTRTLSDIDIQTSTPTISNAGSGFEHRSFSEDGDYGIVSGLFYDDFIVDDPNADNNTSSIEDYSHEQHPAKWMVYLWHKSGSLNNDINRSANMGIRTAVLKRKIISNLRIGDKIRWKDTPSDYNFTGTPQLFSSDDNTIVKVDGHVYKGNIDTMLVPDDASGYFFALNAKLDEAFLSNYLYGTIGSAKFTDIPYFRLYSPTFSPTSDDEQGFYAYREPSTHSSPTDNKAWYNSSIWIVDSNHHIGNFYRGLATDKSPIRMKYKSTPHIVFDTEMNLQWGYADRPNLPVIEFERDNVVNPFGGTSKDALQANVWIPCGEPQKLIEGESCDVEWSYGDTYYQRWDCLKTYAYTPEDENQVIEIGSFMLETHVNIDGRYDRNRGQASNLYMSPRNFNLLNEVYSQQDNFFNYRILDSSFYEDSIYPNQITWSLSKQNSADVDLWTQVTLANTLDLDGDKGELNKIIRLNDQLLAFQDTGISQILYNENTQISTAEGVPIEIANSGKVQGKRYINSTVGCSNKWSITNTPLGIYFMDSNDRSIYLFNGQLVNLSSTNGFNTWAKKNILKGEDWSPYRFANFVAYYDKQNQDVLFIDSYKALAWSEKLGAFTSFYDYGGASYLCNLGNVGIWVKNNDGVSKLWKHQAGYYCNFFGEQKPYGMILVGNPEPLTDKIFTNLEFRASVDTEGSFTTEEVNGEAITKFGTPHLPFDYLETWNEYQHGLTRMQWKNGTDTMRHHTHDEISHLARKFRIWRCYIPRNNAEPVNVFDYSFDDTFHSNRSGAKIDRMRNPWLYIKLKKDNDTDKRVEIHDMVMTYYN